MSASKKLLILALITGFVASGLFVARNSDRIKRRFDMQGLRAVLVARGLEHPWALAFLPSGVMLVTERPGRMRLVSADGIVGAPLEGLPPVHAEGEGGLLDVVLDPAFKNNSRIYWSYSEPAAGGQRGAGTAVARARLEGQTLVDVQVI